MHEHERVPLVEDTSPLADRVEGSQLEEAAGAMAREAGEHAERMDMLARNFARAFKSELHLFRSSIREMVDEAVRDSLGELVRRLFDVAHEPDPAAAAAIANATAETPDRPYPDNTPAGEPEPDEPDDFDPAEIERSPEVQELDTPLDQVLANGARSKAKHPPFEGPCSSCGTETVAPAKGRFAKLCPRCKDERMIEHPAGIGEDVLAAARARLEVES